MPFGCIGNWAKQLRVCNDAVNQVKPLATIKKVIGMNNIEHALGSAAWLVQELSSINQKF